MSGTITHLPKRALAGLAILVLAYLAPEGIGQRTAHSFPLQAALLLLFFPIAALVGRWTGPGPVRAYALERAPGALPLLVLGLLLALAAKLGAVALGLRMGVYAPAAPAAAGSLLAAVPFTFVPSIAEDIVTRGYWRRVLGPGWGTATFVTASALAFVANHVFRLAEGPAEWGMLFAFGLAYAAALARSGTLWAAVGLHWGWNLANAVADVVLPAATVVPAAGRALSAGAHLVLLALVLLLPPFRRTAPLELSAAPIRR